MPDRAQPVAVADARAERAAALRRALLQHQVDALLVTSIPNIRYLTGFSGSAGILVVSPTDALLLTDFRYETQVADEVGDAARVAIESQSLWARLWRELPTMSNVERIGFESAHITQRDFQRVLEAGTGWQWRPLAEVVETLRERKDADEVACIREAARIATTALSLTIPRIRPGVSELAIAGILEHALRDAGSEGYAFETIVASGPRSALPHARASASAVEADTFLLLDFGAIFRGYRSDITRTFVVGRASARHREIHAVVFGAEAAALAGIRAGMTGRDADALARSYIEQVGLGEAFGHSLGHGIGLEVHEAPRLSRLAEGVLPVGAVVTVEPGVYLPGWGGVRIEDDVHLGTTAEVLTDFPRELLEIA